MSKASSAIPPVILIDRKAVFAPSANSQLGPKPGTWIIEDDYDSEYRYLVAGWRPTDGWDGIERRQEHDEQYRLRGHSYHIVSNAGECRRQYAEKDGDFSPSFPGCNDA